MTTVKFGEKSPIVVVGDTSGAVLVYRIFEPVLINQQGNMMSVVVDLIITSSILIICMIIIILNIMS